VAASSGWFSLEISSQFITSGTNPSTRTGSAVGLNIIDRLHPAGVQKTFKRYTERSFIGFQFSNELQLQHPTTNDPAVN
jgi:hypothetical protein